MVAQLGYFTSIVSQNLQKMPRHFTAWASEAPLIVLENREETNSFQAMKAVCEKDLLMLRIMSVAALVANITFAVLGLGLSLAKWQWVGPACLLINIPLSYLSYNLYQLTKRTFCFEWAVHLVKHLY